MSFWNFTFQDIRKNLIVGDAAYVRTVETCVRSWEPSPDDDDEETKTNNRMITEEEADRMALEILKQITIGDKMMAEIERETL